MDITERAEGRKAISPTNKRELMAVARFRTLQKKCFIFGGTSTYQIAFHTMGLISIDESVGVARFDVSNYESNGNWI